MDAQAWKSWLIGIVAGIGLGLGVVPPSQAYHFPWDQGHDTTDWDDPPPPGPCEGPNCDPCKSTGSPVYLPTGHFVWTDTDVVLKGRPALAISRTFNSHDPRDGLFGNGWTVSCDEALYKVVKANLDGTTLTQYILRISNGKRYEYTQQSDGTITPPPGRFEQIAPQANGTVQLIALDGSRKVFRADGKFAQDVDRNGNTILYSYDPNGLLNQIADGNGRALTLTYNSSGRVAFVKDHTARAWQYDYDANGNLELVTDPLGGVRKYAYQAHQPPGDGNTYWHLTKITDASGVVVTQVAYLNERVTSYTAGANTFKYSYDLTNKLVTKTDSLNSAWRFTYNADGLITEEVDPLNNKTTYTFDVNGNQLQRVDSLNKVWQSTYDNLGRLLGSTTPLSETLQLAYGGSSPVPVTVTSPTGRVTKIGYDVHLNPVNVTDPLGAMTQFKWNSQGDMIETIDAGGNHSTATFNATGLLTSASDPIKRATSFVYDARGNLIELINAAGEKFKYEYDDLDRPTRFVDALGQTTILAYDAIGRLLSVTDPAGHINAFSFDTQGRMASRTSADGRAWKYSYRADNLPSQVALPDTRVINYSYDAAKHLTSENAAGVVTNYSYSARGELISASNPSGTISRTYDAVGRVAGETTNGQTISLAYNGGGERTQLTALGTVANFSYNDRGLLTAISRAEQTFSFARDVLGRRTRLDLPNGAATDYGYDAASQLTQIVHSGPFSATYSYSFDPAGRTTHSTGDGAGWNYQYDILGRLTKSTHGADTLNYSYDAVGNILDNGRKHDTANRLNEDNEYTFTYDALGNLTKKQHKVTGARTVYSWSAKSQLLKVERFPDATSTVPTNMLEYTYDPLGRRLSKTENNVVERFVYDGSDLIAVLNGAGSVQKRVTFGPGIDEPLGLSTATGDYYFHANHQGSVMALSGATNIAAQYSYDPYGATQATDPIGNPFRYTGREQDATDLYYYRARYYDPTIQRFLSEDPTGLAGGINLYAYAGGNPVNNADPTGTQPGSPDWCRRQAERISNIEQKIQERIGELDENPGNLPEACPGDNLKPSLSRRGHRKLINMDKANLAAQKALYAAYCGGGGGPPPVPVPVPQPVPQPAPSNNDPFSMEYWAAITGLSGAALVTYIIVSEGSRLFPPRNLIPVP